MSALENEYKSHVISWLQDIVIGLNLCPFARKPFEANQVSIVYEDNVKHEDAMLEIVLRELCRLEDTPVELLETTLIVLPNAYPDFNDFNSLLFVLNEVLVLEGFEGVFQIASFHPNYQFADTQETDSENFTNRSPYPIIHLIREESVSKALDSHPNPDVIPESNIKRLQALSNAEFGKLFSYLLDKNH